MQPIKFFLHSISIDMSTFVDDSISISTTKARAAACLRIIIFVFQCAGWTIEDSKTIHPCQILTYLGYILNTNTMIISVPHVKLQSLSDDIVDMINMYKREEEIGCKAMAHVLGTCCHMIVSHGDIMRVATRGCQQALGMAVQNAAGWDGHVSLSERLVWELEFIQSILVRLVYSLYLNSQFNLSQLHVHTNISHNKYCDKYINC